jgi:hypothetical protein
MAKGVVGKGEEEEEGSWWHWGMVTYTHGEEGRATRSGGQRGNGRMNEGALSVFL